MFFQSIPSPSESVWHLGPLPLRAYALAIICGILAAWVILTRRYRAKGGPVDLVPDMAVVMVICGILGGRLYHVITDYDLYFGEGRNPVTALYVWKGGLGIWGAIALGGLGAYAFCRRRGMRIGPVGDALAPGLLLAQAIGRLGNYFNQELYGKPTDLPWALEIDDAHLAAGYPSGTTFHPTFLYEMLWCLAGAVVLLLVERRFELVAGQLFAAYVMVYTSGRVWIECLRIDDAHRIMGLRLNVWTSIVVFLAALAVFVLLSKRAKTHPEMDDIWASDAARERYERLRPSEEDAFSDVRDIAEEQNGKDDGETENPAGRADDVGRPGKGVDQTVGFEDAAGGGEEAEE